MPQRDILEISVQIFPETFVDFITCHFVAKHSFDPIFIKMSSNEGILLFFRGCKSKQEVFGKEINKESLTK